uniref:Replication protein A OB domain-containing protein n=1 Tax=Magallana gigas TaxID=29159 RepID=A0A8W8MLX4_MAGGI
MLTKIGDVAKITKSRREIQISSENRTANLTLWGTIAEDSCIEAESTYNIIAIKAENEFRGQLAFNSTPSTIFEKIENAPEKEEEFRGGVESVSFESNLIEVNGTILNVSSSQLNQIFPTNTFVRLHKVTYSTMETTKETTSATNPPLRHQINTRDTKAHLTVFDVFKSKTSTHRVIRLDQGGGVPIKLWGSKSSLFPAVGSSIEATS